MSDTTSLPVWFDDTFILSLIGIIGGGCTAILAYMLKSRCTKVNCLCMSCERVPLPPSPRLVQNNEIANPNDVALDP